jgi:uncharacterized membrane protein YuzA (DUF378 family)
MKSLDVLAKVLLIVGGLNWGLWGIFQFDLVAALFGGNSAGLSRIIYSLVGVAAVYYALGWKSVQQRLAMQKS